MVRLLPGACTVSFCGYYSALARFFQAREPELPRARDRAFFPALEIEFARAGNRSCGAEWTVAEWRRGGALRQTLSVLRSDQKKQLGME